MKLHLPLSLRSALLSACVLVGLNQYTEAASRYWVDATGQQHEVVYNPVDSGMWPLGIENAESFVIQDCVMTTDDHFFYVSGGGMYYGVYEMFKDSNTWWDEESEWYEWIKNNSDKVGKEIITAKQVKLINNKALSPVEYNDYGYAYGGGDAEGGALSIDFTMMEDEGPYQGGYNDPQLRYFSFVGCGEITITGNSAQSDDVPYSYDWYDSDLPQPEGWYGMAAWGGAIEVIGNNGATEWCWYYGDEDYDIGDYDEDGYYHQGGAYCITERRSVLEFRDNEHVLIRGNYVRTGDKVFLNAIDTGDADVTFAASAGGTIECYDSLMVEGTLWVNTTHPGLRDESKESTYTGTVILSGEHAVEDLTNIKNGTAPTAEEIEYSRRIYTEAVYAERGTLIIKDMEVRAIQDLACFRVYHPGLFYSGYEAEVQLTNATLHTEYGWYNNWWHGINPDMEYNHPIQYGSVVMHNASFTGHNIIRANMIESYYGVWTFHVAAMNKEEALLTIVSNDVHGYDGYDCVYSGSGFNHVGNVFRILAEEGLASGTYKLMEMDSSMAATWSPSEIQLDGDASGNIAGKDVYYTVDGDGAYTLWYDYRGADNTPSTPGQPGERPAAALVWNTRYGVWAQGSGASNWSSNGVEDTNFYVGDSVEFNKAAEVEVSGVVRPATVLVSHGEGVVVLRGEDDDATITGDASLIKRGEGELELDLKNAYTGGTIIDGGRVTAKNNYALGIGDVELRSGVLDLSRLNFEDIKIRVTGEATLLGSMWYSGSFVLDGGKLDGDAIWATYNQTIELISGSMSNDIHNGSGEVVKTGTGSVTLSGNLGNSGGVMVEAGTLELKGSNVSTNVTVKEEATLVMRGVTLDGHSITLNAGAVAKVDTLTLYEGSELNSAGAAIEGDITLEGGEFVTTAAQSISGNVTLSGGTVQLADTLVVKGSLSSTAETEALLDVQKLRKQGKMDVIIAEDLSGMDKNQLNFSQLKDARYVAGTSSTSVWVALQNAKLTWKPGASNVWGVREEGGKWNTDAADESFYNYDDVTFEDAGEVRIAGEVTPGEITVTGEKDTIFTGEGSIAGDATLTKQGSGTLRIETDNSNYTGEIIVKGGTLEVGGDNALGSNESARAVRIENAAFNGGGKWITREVTLSGNSRLEGGSNVNRMRFESGAVVESSFYQLNNTLIIGEGGAEFKGAFHFGQWSRLLLTGGKLTISGSVTHDAPFTYDDSIIGGYYAAGGRAWYDDMIENMLPSVTTIDVSGWEELLPGEEYELLELRLEDGVDINRLFSVEFGEYGWNYTLEYDEEHGSVILHVQMAELAEEVVQGMSSNQKSVYNALQNIQNTGKLQGELQKEVSKLFSNDTSPAEARAILDKLSGAELATALTSQIEGNMAHMRRLRANMGSGERLDNEGKNSVYVLGYDAQNRVDANEVGPGIRRTEWGGTLGYERQVREESLMGFAITSGSATVKPTMGESYDEDAVRLDLYGVGNFGNGWQGMMSVGVGKHEYSIRRQLPTGREVSASPTGFSVNVQQEVSYTKKLNEQSMLQPYVSLEMSANVINAFTEEGGGSASLESHDSATSAVDLTVGARYIRRFQSAGRTGSVSLQAAIVASLGESATEMELNYAGSPENRFTVGAASTDAVGINLGASVQVPVSKNATIIGTANGIMRSGAEEMGASVGLRVSF